MAVIDDITELAQDTYFSINGAENDDTGDDLTLFQNGFIRAYNLWVKEYETEAYWKVARVTNLVLTTLADTTTFSFALPTAYRTPIFDQNNELKFALDDGTIIARFSLVNPNQRQADSETPLRPDRATFLEGGRNGGGTIILSRPPTDEEVGAKIVLDVVKFFPKLTRTDGTVLDWVANDQIATLGISKNMTLSDVTKVSLSPSFTQRYTNELNKAVNINNASTETDQMVVDDFSSIGGIF